MALAPLATVADLSARGVDTSDTTRVAAALSAASDAVRDAAGCAISQTTSTITLPGTVEEFILLPGGPVTAVSSVSMDGNTVLDWSRVDDLLFRAGGWMGLFPLSFLIAPATRYPLIQVTYTHGLATIPADIVSLVCDLATAQLTVEPGSRVGITSEGVGDYRVTYADATSLLDLPERTRARLRARFGTGTASTGMRG